MKERGTPLREFIHSGINYGIKTGFNEAFVIDWQTRGRLIAEDSRSSEIIKPLAVGDDVRKWHVRKQNRWLIVTKVGVDMSRYPAVMRHLKQWQSQLEARADKGDYWWELRRCAYYDAFNRAKIVYPVIGKEPRFTFDRNGMFTNDKTFFIETDDMFLCGLLNSAAVWLWLQCRASALGDAADGGRLELRSIYMEKVPVPPVSSQDRAKIEGLVTLILDLKDDTPSLDVSELEDEIDRRVEFLYFHADEAPTYDEWVAKQEAERGTAIAEIRRLCAARESGIVEFKQSLEYVDAANFAHVPEAQRGQRIAETQKAVVHSALKTICAFLNSCGGTLLLGVHDRGDIIGIEPDYTLCGKKQDVDGFELKLTDFLKTRIRPLPANLNIGFVVVDGKTVCRIDVPAEPRPHYLDNKLYIRFGNSTEELTGRELADWLQQRPR